MTITTTLSEVLEKCSNWDDFCDKKGFSVWAVNEGGGHIEVSLTKEEAIEFGLIQKERN